MSETGSEDGYRPGACNIGRAERRKRYAVGVLGFLFAAAVVAVVVAVALPPAALLSTALPLFGGFLGYLQGRRRFCVAFARAGVYDTSEEGGERREVTDPDDHDRDTTAARTLYRDAALAAAATAIVLYALGVLVGA